MNFESTTSVGDNFIFIDEKKQEYTITGLLIIRNLNGDQLASFLLKLVFDPHTKRRFPKVSEVVPTLPIDQNRHINEDGTFCLAMIHREIILCSNGLTFEQFINTILIPFLSNQYLIEIGEVEDFLMGEYEHKEKGILQYYQELFPGFTLEQLLSILAFIGRREINRRQNVRCPCGSGRFMNYCHYDVFKELKSMGKERILEDFATLELIYQGHDFMKNENIQLND